MTVVVQKQNDVVILADSKKNYVAALKGTVVVAGTSNVSSVTGFTDANGFIGNITANNLSLALANVTGVDSITFDDGVNQTTEAGKFWYNSETGGWNLGMGGGNITQQVGEELFIRGKASAAISDTHLQLVYKTGVVGASGVYQFAPVIAGITNSYLILGVATDSIPLNGFGRITTSGLVNNTNTTGSAYGETWNDGDVIWYEPISGGLTNVKPTAPNLKFQVGTIVRAANNGAFYVEMQHGSSLGGTDSNVELANLTTGDIIVYNGNLSRFENKQLIAGSNINITTSANGNITISSTATGNASGITGFTNASGFNGTITDNNLSLTLQNANATQSGQLTSTDWSLFNGANGNVTVLQNLTTTLNQTLNNHTGNFTNPHNVTKTQVGLGNVSDIAPLDLPISNATQTALNAKLDVSQKGAANGVAELVNGTVPISQLPSYVDDVVESANFAALPVTGESGKIYITLDDNLTYRWSGSAYVEISKSLALGETSATAYRGDRGAIAYNHSQTTHDKAFVGLGNVDNTSDLDKPISNATQSALNTKANANLTINGQSLNGNVTLTTANVSDSTNKRYVSDDQLANINNITTNHSALSNINWTNSGHTGNASTVAGFASDGAAQYLTTNGSGSVVLTSNAALTNANLTTPILGTPQSGNLTNCNGTAQNLTAGNVSYLNLSANTTNISGTLGLSNGGTNSNLTALTLKLQEVSNISSAYTNTTASIPYDNTKPQSSEGTLILTKTITPKSVNSTLKISTQLWVAANEASRIIGAVFSNVTGADALSSGHTFITATSTEAVFPLPMQAVHTPNTTNPVNISVRVGSATSKTVSVNGVTSGAVLGGSLQSSLVILEEIDLT